MENEGTIIMVVIGFITFLITIITSVGSVVWLLGNINKSLSDSIKNLELALKEKISNIEQSIKDLRLELKQEMRDRLHKARSDIGENIQNIDERVDKLETNQSLLLHRVEQIEKCLNTKSVCNLE